MTGETNLKIYSSQFVKSRQQANPAINLLATTTWPESQDIPIKTSAKQQSKASAKQHSKASMNHDTTQVTGPQKQQHQILTAIWPMASGNMHHHSLIHTQGDKLQCSSNTEKGQVWWSHLYPTLMA